MRLNLVIICAMAGTLAACSDGSDPAQDAADVAEIEAMHDMPAIEQISPQHIRYPDIEKNNLFGASCGFAPGNSMKVLFLAQDEHGYMKLDDKIVTLAPDKGSAELPLTGFSKYDGKEFSVTITLDENGKSSEGIEQTKWQGRMVVRDHKDRVTFDREGLVGCGA
ncbi:hypothetical protein [Croceicoccus sediminis]|uniref:hypothetical protein n=1 Tax=Croceicoccus sediminis TaxID=2571150 RepID=UPI0011836B33|nr:hypothetical protein [Croceicoccus sediminis]